MRCNISAPPHQKGGFSQKTTENHHQSWWYRSSNANIGLNCLASGQMKYRVKYQCMIDVKGPNPLGKVKTHILGYVMKSFQSKVCLNFWQLNAMYKFILKPSTNLQKISDILQFCKYVLCHTSPLPKDFKQVGIETNLEVTHYSNYINPS